MGGRGATSQSGSSKSHKPSMTAEQAINDYTKEGYRKIRAFQEGRIPDDGAIGEQARIIEQYISQNGGLSGKTFRGIVLESVPNYSIGGIIDMRGTSSWSASQSAAKEFGKPKLYGTYGVIFSSVGQKRGVDITSMSDAKHESEVIVSKHSRYRVKKVSKKGSIYYVDLTEE